MSKKNMPGVVMWYAILFSVALLHSARGQVSYSIPEEMAKGSTVGNIAQDLGLDLQRLRSGKARIYTGDSTEYIGLNKETGLLFIKEKMDRESLCAKNPVRFAFSADFGKPHGIIHDYG